MILPFVLSLTVAFAPLPQAAPEPPADPSPSCVDQVKLTDSELAKARRIAAALRAAEAKATEDPVGGIPGLQRALNEAHEEALLVARVPDTAEARKYAQLALAGGWLANNDRVPATALIDRALALAPERKLPVALYGPSLVALHDERRESMSTLPHRALTVTCAAACIVVIDATLVGCAGPSSPLVIDLPLGKWNVIAAAAANPQLAKQAEVYAGDGNLPELELTAADLGVEGPVELAQGGTSQDTRRRLPRWAGILGMTIGAAALVTGGVLVGVDARCPNLKSSSSGESCTRRLNTDKPGYAVLATGAVLMVGFTIPFAIGESRAAKAKRNSRQGPATARRP